MLNILLYCLLASCIPSSDSIELMRQDTLINQYDYDNIEIGELIFDETITKIGRDFYAVFFAEWENPTIIKDYSIFIRERPMPGMGTQVSVYIQETEIFRQFLKPNIEAIETSVNEAIIRTKQYLINYENLKSSLENEDQSGSGIY